MSGQGTRYRKEGYTSPKPLIPVNGLPMITRLLNNFDRNWNYHFIVAENHRETALPETLRQIRPSGQIFFIPPHTAGPTFAIQPALPSLPSDTPIAVSYCDYGMNWDHAAFEKFVQESDCDACLICYRGFHAHYLTKVNYAFARTEGKHVVEVREKGHFTDNRENEFASAGFYYFKNKAILEEAIAYQVAHGLKVNGEYYTSLTVEALLRANPSADVRVFEIPGFYQWGTPQDLRDFEYWEKCYAAVNRQTRQTAKVPQLLIPMAGWGSRFAKYTELPKPAIRLQGQPMFEHAVLSLPAAENQVFITQNRYATSKDFLAFANCKIVGVEEIPNGQALTVKLGLDQLHDSGSILVSACDHKIIINSEKWEKLLATEKIDAAIFTIRSFPGVHRQPMAYSYVEPLAADDSRVARVSIKRPISDSPARDHLLVGTFWFRSKNILATGLDALIRSKELVNGELYMDGIFNVLIEQGYQIAILELDGYINWGDPESLKEALYWQEIFCGQRLDQRSAFPGVQF